MDFEFLVPITTPLHPCSSFSRGVLQKLGSSVQQERGGKGVGRKQPGLRGIETIQTRHVVGEGSSAFTRSEASPSLSRCPASVTMRLMKLSFGLSGVVFSGRLQIL